MNINNQVSSTLQSPVVVQQEATAPVVVGTTVINEDSSHSRKTIVPTNAHPARAVQSSSSSNSSISSCDDEEEDSRSSISSNLFEHREVAEAEDLCNRQDGRATSASVPPADFCDNSSQASSTSGSGYKSRINLPTGSTDTAHSNYSNVIRRPHINNSKKKASEVKRNKSNASSCSSSSSSSLSAGLPPSSTPRSSSRTNKLSSQHHTQQQHNHHHHSRFTTDVTRPSSTANPDIVRTDEIALFMRNKKRYSQSDLKPIPPAPGGWDEPDRVVPWDKTADHDFSSSLPVKSNTWKNVSWIHEVDASQLSSSYDKPTRAIKQRPISEPNIRAHDLRPPSSNTNATSSSSSSSLASAASSNISASAHRKERPCSLELSDCSAFRPLLYAQQQKQHQSSQPGTAKLPPFRMRSSSHHELNINPPKDTHLTPNNAAVGHLPSKISTDTSKFHPLVPPPESPRSFLDTPSLWSDGFLGRKRAPHSATAAADMTRSVFEDSFTNDPIHPPWKIPSQDWQRTPKGTSPANNCWGPISPLSPPWHHPLDEPRAAMPEVRRWDTTADHGWEDRFASILRVVDDECSTASATTPATTISTASSLSKPFHPPPPPSTTTSNSSNGHNNNNTHNEAAAASAMAASAATWSPAPGTTHSKNRLHLHHHHQQQQQHQDGFLVANAQLLQNIVQTGSMGCRHCGSGTHTAARDCPYIPLLNPSDAWLALKESGQRGDTRVFLRALDIYSKSRPTETLPSVAQQLHHAGSLLHLIAVPQQQQQLPSTTLLIDLQGITRKRYRVIVASLADKHRVPGFPTSLEQNLARLAEAGFPRDLTDMATCLLCDQAGHWAKDCVYNTSHAVMASIRRASDPVGGSKRYHQQPQLHPNNQQAQRHQQQQHHQQHHQQQQQRQQQQSYPALGLDESRQLYLSGVIPL